jgi:hypothetical protein
MISRIKMTLVTGAVALATAAAGTGMASGHSAQLPTQTPTPIPPASFSTGPGSPGMSHWYGHWRGCRHGRMMGWGILSRIEHGEATLKTAHGQEVMDLQHGTVESVSSGKLTVRSADGFSATYVVDHSTKIRKNGRSSGVAQVMTNDQVIVLATKSGNTATATHINDTGPAATNH